MQQPKLPFQRISVDDAHKQRVSIAVKFEEERVAAAAAAPPAAVAEPMAKRGPGRPPKKRELADPAAAAQPQPAQKPRTGVYTSWFSSPYINDVLQELQKQGFNAKRTVAALKQHAPDDRYARLSNSTVRGWFQKGTRDLIPAFQEQLNAQHAAKRGGRPPAMSAEVEDECKPFAVTLTRFRFAGEQPCHSLDAPCCFLREVSGAAGEHTAVTAVDQPLGACQAAVALASTHNCRLKGAAGLGAARC